MMNDEMETETLVPDKSPSSTKRRLSLWWLRVAFSVIALAALAALVVLWWRSYTYAEGFVIPGTLIRLTHFKGEIGFHGRDYSSLDRVRVSGIPYLLLVVSAGVLPALPWVKWSRRFSIRGMLMIATVVALALAALFRSLEVVWY